MYGHGGHLGYVTQLICINFYSHAPISFQMKFNFKSPKNSEKKVSILKSM